MSETERYAVVRSYSSRCGMDELIRRIIRRHIKCAYPENVKGEYLDPKGTNHGSREDA